jgi:60 kDa SS-A/Ro ribonucleoprotein
MAVLIAMKTYASGRGKQHTWEPNQKVCDALDSAFYLSFKAVKPAGKRFVLALDVSASMDGGVVAGADGLTPRIASCAMSLITAATEPNTTTIAFSSGSRSSLASSYSWYNRTSTSDGLDGVSEINITPKDRLDTVAEKSDALSVGMGATQIDLPFKWAQAKGVQADVFVVYTDNEVNRGTHPVEALRNYRKATGINAKLIVVGLTSTGFTVADPNDAGMMDVVGMDASAPSVMAEFSRK